MVNSRYMSQLRFERISVLVVLLLPAALLGPANAGQFEMLMTRGPIPYLQGQPLIVSQGRLTAGDYANPTWGDYTGDGKPDLIVGSDYGDLVLYRRQEDLKFGPPEVLLRHSTALAAIDSGAAICPRLCDLDRDGRTDLVVGYGEQLLVYWASDRMSKPQTLFTEDRRPLFGQAQVRGLAPEVADFDGDGTLDLIVGDESGQVWWIANSATEGPPALSPAVPLVTAGGTPIVVPGRARPAAGDFTGDGILDLLVGDAAGRLHLYRGTAEGLAPAELVPLQAGNTPAVSPTLANLDGDGPPQLLIGDGDGFVSVYRTTAEGLHSDGYLRSEQVPFDVGRAAAVTSVDYDGDGMVDVVVGAADGHIWVCLKRSDGFREPRLITDQRGQPIRAGEPSDPTPYAWPRLIDINGDGTLDLLVGNRNGTVQVWLNQGGLRYVGLLELAGAPLRVNGISAIELVDYDGDGDYDLLVGAAPPPLPDDFIPNGSHLPQFVLPEGGLVYFENMGGKGPGMPAFRKGVRMLGFLGDEDDASAPLHAGLLGLRYAEPLLLKNARWTFLVGTCRGWYYFDTTADRTQYPILALPGDASALPRAVIPPLYSVTATRSASSTTGSTRFGLLCGTDAYGFVCHYPPESVTSLAPR